MKCCTPGKTTLNREIIYFHVFIDELWTEHYYSKIKPWVKIIKKIKKKL